MTQFRWTSTLVENYCPASCEFCTLRTLNGERVIFGVLLDVRIV